MTVSDTVTQTLSRGLDTALDRSVALGYTALGHGVRRRLPTWPADPPPGALRGRDVLVTGASSGLGARTAVDLARLGAHVHLVVREPARCAEVIAELGAAGAGDRHTVWRCDVADPGSIRAFVAAFLASGRLVHGLVHNAGVLPATRQEDGRGHELTMAVHVLGPVAMTEGLLPAMAGQQSRVVLVTSGGMYAESLHLDDLDYRRGAYHGPTAYARSKRAQVELLGELQRRWGGSGAAVYATHPGWAQSPGVTTSLPRFARLTAPFLRRGDAGVDTTTWLIATQPRPDGGGLWHDRRQRPTSYLGRTRPTPQERDRLWQWVSGELGH
jgi:NAD(P)-dependent dehydrogenase (short-subunit alcohol dehydrogenase family)